MDKYVRPVFASYESVALGVVKPLNLTFVLSHWLLPSLGCARIRVSPGGGKHLLRYLLRRRKLKRKVDSLATNLVHKVRRAGFLAGSASATSCLHRRIDLLLLPFRPVFRAYNRTLVSVLPSLTSPLSIIFNTSLSFTSRNSIFSSSSGRASLADQALRLKHDHRPRPESLGWA